MATVGSAGPNPGLADGLAEEVRQRIDQFPNPALRQTVEHRLIGHINEEIRERLGRSPCNVSPKL